jgi:hypothetical protein
LTVQYAPAYQRPYNLIDRKRFDMGSTLEDVPEGFLIDGVLHRSVTLIYGQTNVGKSTIAASIAAALATGREEWSGRTVSPSAHGPVVIVCGDPDSRYEYQERLFKVLDEFTDMSQFIELVAPFRPTSPEGWEEVRSVVAETGAKVVIIDNLSAFIGGTLSDDALIKQFYVEMDKFTRQGIAVLVLAHVSDKTGPDGKAARLPIGSALIRFGPRWWALAWKGGGKVRLEFDGNSGGAWWLDLSEPDGIPRFDVVDSKTTSELREGREKRARERSDKTNYDRSEVGDWVVANCQGMSREQAAMAIAGQFGYRYKASTAKSLLSNGAFGGVKQAGPRNARRWERCSSGSTAGT